MRFLMRFYTFQKTFQIEILIICLYVVMRLVQLNKSNQENISNVVGKLEFFTYSFEQTREANIFCVLSQKFYIKTIYYRFSIVGFSRTYVCTFRVPYLSSYLIKRNVIKEVFRRLKLNKVKVCFEATITYSSFS